MPKSEDIVHPFVLITVLYNELHPARIAEYVTCLGQNLANLHISTIHVLYDTSRDTKEGENLLLTHLKNNDVVITPITGRPTYQYCFDLINREYPNRRILLCNADIYFNDTLSALSNYDLAGKFLALTRWNIHRNGTISLFQWRTQKMYNSQDVWIFQTPLRPFYDGSMQLGTLGCDRRIAYQALKAGLDVLNPCKTIQCLHLQHSNVRNYKLHEYPPNEYSIWTPWCYLPTDPCYGVESL